MYMNYMLLNIMHGQLGIKRTNSLNSRVNLLTYLCSRSKYLIYTWQFIVKFKTIAMVAAIEVLTDIGWSETPDTPLSIHSDIGLLIIDLIYFYFYSFWVYSNSGFFTQPVVNYGIFHLKNVLGIINKLIHFNISINFFIFLINTLSIILFF